MSSLLDALIAQEEFPPLKGDRGPKGDVGDKGEKGDTGYQGLEGPTGPMGPDGPKGNPGPEGPEGKRGPRGFKGDTGEKGDIGPEGPAGRDGGVAGGRGSYNVRGLASGMVIDDEGTKLNSGAVVGEIDFVGSGVSTAIVGSKAVVTVTGGSGLPAGGTVGQVVTNTAPGAGTWQNAAGGDLADVLTAGGDPDGHPITGQLLIAPTDDLVDPLLQVTAPAGFKDNSPNGSLVSLYDETGRRVMDFQISGDITLDPAVGWGASGILMKSADFPTYKLDLYSGSPSNLDFIIARSAGVEVFRVGSLGGVFIRSHSDVEPLYLQGNTAATVPVIRAYPGAGQTGALVELNDDNGDPAFVVGPAGQLGIFGKAVTPATQQTAASLSDLWAGLKAYGLLDTASAAPATSGSFLSSAKWGTD